MTTDHYPTRGEREPALLPRREPTVWGGVGGPLDADTLKHFDDAGYLTEEQLVSAEDVTRYSEELDRLAMDPRCFADSRTVLDRDTQEVRSIFEVHKISEVFSELAHDPRVVDRVRQILGSDVYVHQSRVNYKPGLTGKDFYWHSNFETWHAEDGMPQMRAVVVSIALTANHTYNGSLMVMPGSHQTFVSCVDDTSDDEHPKESLFDHGTGTPDQESLKALADRHGIEMLTGPAGGAAIFDSNAMHGSNSNITPYPRSNVFIAYNSTENTLVDPYVATSPRPDFIAARDFTPVP
ncbi:MAG: ectoine hydroxylase [Micromonosporaceae bacterium]